MGAWASIVLEFLQAVLGHWVALATGGLVVALLNLWEKRHGTIPWHITRWVFLIFLLAAVFLAWNDQHRLATAVGKSVIRLTGERDEARQYVVDRDRQITNLGTQTTNLGSQIVNREAEVGNRDKSLTNRDNQITSRDAQIGGLQAQVGKQQETISDLLAQIEKVRQPEALIVTMLSIGTAVPNPSIAPNVTSFLVLTNKEITPVKSVIACDNAMVNVEARLVGAGFIDVGTSRLAPNAFGFVINSPPWTPRSPLLLTVYHEKDLGICRVIP